MSGPASSEPITFDVIHNDGWIRVFIENGFATIIVDHINDVGIVIRALNKAAASVTRGTMFTGECVNDKLGLTNIWRAAAGKTWLGGRVTRLADTADGPQFRIDWDSLPTITE
jgi:hypothetical protein